MASETLEGELAHATQAADPGGLPQLDFTTWPSQIFWLAIALVALYQLMTKIALPRISSVIEERADAIADDLDRAEEFRRKAEEAQGAYDKALAEARGKAQAIAAETRAQIGADVEAEMARADEEIAARAAESERRIKEIRDSAMESVEAVAVETAGALVDAVTPQIADPAAVQAAVKAELG